MAIPARIFLFIPVLFNPIMCAFWDFSANDAPKNMKDVDSHFMHKALSLASNALGCTRPNPCVGCVIVDKNGTIVGEGWHRKAGDVHAEVAALKEAGLKAVGSTVYVSLEPCNHYGRTPPCTEALLKYILSMHFPLSLSNCFI